MHLKTLALRNFRNYSHADLSFSPGTNLIQGKNGQGKSNLLEAIALITTGRSFRTHNLSELIRFGEKFFYIGAEFEKGGMSHTLTLYYDAEKRLIEYNGASYTTLHSLLGILPSILLAPHDLQLITGAPGDRRRFLDLHIAQTDPTYLYHLGRYFRAMKQRNHLLRTADLLTLGTWEQMMAPSAGEIIRKRITAITSLGARLKKWVSLLSDEQDEVELHYRALEGEGDIEGSLRVGWEKMRSKEQEAGHTLLGPHRDDLTLQLSHKSAKHFSSEGQKRGCIAALRFAEWEQMAELLLDTPLLGIDDFGIQLDERRQALLQENLSIFSQVFLTSPHFKQEEFLTSRVFHVAKGSINL